MSLFGSHYLDNSSKFAIRRTWGRVVKFNSQRGQLKEVFLFLFYLFPGKVKDWVVTTKEKLFLSKHASFLCWILLSLPSMELAKVVNLGNKVVIACDHCFSYVEVQDNLDYDIRSIYSRPRTRVNALPHQTWDNVNSLKGEKGDFHETNQHQLGFTLFMIAWKQPAWPLTTVA